MLSYEQYPDEELIALLRSGEHEIGNYLMEKYKNMVRKKARALFLMGGDNDDLIQEGMIGLFQAIQDYDSQRGASFYRFADVCVSGQMHKAIEASQRQKHQPLNSYVSIYEENTESSGTAALTDSSALSIQNPEELVIDKESAQFMHDTIQNHLSKFEQQVLDLYLGGLNYYEIADRLGKSNKAVDNALQRIKKKAKQVV